MHGGNEMAFYPIYYITLVCPDLATSKQKIEEYIAHGARALQIDMPSKDPVFETPFVRENMKRALQIYEGYDTYLDFFRRIREKYPYLELHLVAYPDVVERIGKDKYVFQDATGKITVEIDHKVFGARIVTPQTRVRLNGEVESEFFRRNEVDVDVLEILDQPAQ